MHRRTGRRFFMYRIWQWYSTFSNAQYANMHLAVTLGILIRESEFRINALPKHNDFVSHQLRLRLNSLLTHAGFIDHRNLTYRRHQGQLSQEMPATLGRGS